MRSQRHIEETLLGYRIDRICQFDEHGTVSTQWYEVLAPESDHVLGIFAQRSEAERAVVACELAAFSRPAAA